jgi:acyl-coenzyme A thioesterase PaaI-like protein
MNDNSAPTLDEQAGHCFACGPANPQGLHLHFDRSEHPETGHPTVAATVNLTRIYEGPPGYIHGGIIATLFDEAMSKLNRPLDTLAMTRHMEVDYLRPSPLFQPLTLTATHERREGRKLFHSAQLHNAEGTLLAQAEGLFIAINPATIPSNITPEKAGH